MTLARFTLLAALVLVTISGCRQPASEHKQPAADQKKEIETALAKLSPEDRKLAEAQRMCPIGNEPLGSMGTPVRLELNNEVVFLCCEGCEKSARKDAEKTIARVKALRTQGEKQ